MSHVVWTIVVAAGSGARYGRPKQFDDLNGRRIVDRAVDAARQVSNGVVVVVPAGTEDDDGFDVAVAGGSTRSESVRRGLDAVPDDADVIVVHDGARPLATVDLFRRVIEAVEAGADGAVPGMPVTDTIKQILPDGTVVNTPDRARLVAVQTPQAFAAHVLRRAHAGHAEATDDAALIEAAGGHVVVVAGEADNRKITRPEDLEWAAARCENHA